MDADASVGEENAKVSLIDSELSTLWFTVSKFFHCCKITVSTNNQFPQFTSIQDAYLGETHIWLRTEALSSDKTSRYLSILDRSQFKINGSRCSPHKGSALL